MDICRTHNGETVTYTLTPAELRKAYEEQQHLYDVSDIEHALCTDREYYEDGYGIEESPVNNGEIEEMSSLLRKCLDDDADSSWSSCVQYSIITVLSQRNDRR